MTQLSIFGDGYDGEVGDSLNAIPRIADETASVTSGNCCSRIIGDALEKYFHSKYHCHRGC